MPAVFRRFPGAKDKSLILLQWTTGGYAVLILNKIGTLALEETAGVQVIVSKELPGSAVEVIGALAAYHRHVSTRVASALGGKRAGLNSELLHRIRWRDVQSRVAGGVVEVSAIEPVVVHIGPRAVHVHAWAAACVGDVGVVGSPYARDARKCCSQTHDIASI